LAAMGFVHLIEMRFTPRLVFYVLGRDRENESEGKGGEGGGGGEAIVGGGALNAHTDILSSGKVEIEVGTGVGAVSWKHLVQSAFSKHSHVQKARGGRSVWTEDHFCRDFSAVPSGEFCLSMATVLDREGEEEGDSKRPKEELKGQGKKKDTGQDKGGQAKKKRKER
jgi:hypothetical protein